MTLTYLRAIGKSRAAALARLTLTLSQGEHRDLDLGRAHAVPTARPYTLVEAQIHARKLPVGIYVYRAAGRDTGERPELSRLDVPTFLRTHPVEHYLLVGIDPVQFRQIHRPVQAADYWHVLVKS